MKIKLASNTIPNSHLESLANWVKTFPRLTKGSKTEDFEKEFSKYLGVKFTRLVNSGSSANLLIAASNLFYKKLKNKNVAIPAVSWSTTLSPFIQLGYTPHLVDCDPINLGMNIDHLHSLIKEEQISTLILVHVLGHDSNIEKIIDLCEENDIRVFEDTCESIGSVCRNQKLGSFGLASSFSFYYGHHISTIEGGAICGNDLEFMELVTSLRSHGWSRDLNEKLRNDLTRKYEVSDFRNLYSFYYPGFNLRSTEINAYLGLLQLDLIESYCLKRSKLFKLYKERLKKFWCQCSDCEFISSFAYGTLVENPDAVWRSLDSVGIESRPLICGSMGLQPFWREINKSYSSFQYADQVHNYGIYLPINADMTEEDVNKVCDEFNKVATPYYFI